MNRRPRLDVMLVVVALGGGYLAAVPTPRSAQPPTAPPLTTSVDLVPTPGPSPSATALIEAPGPSAAAVASVTTTLGVYSHTEPGQGREAAGRVARKVKVAG